MTRTFSRMLCACATAAALAAVLLAAPAQANVQIPGLNGKIAWMTDRDFPPAPISKGIEPSCFADTFNFDCALEIYSMNPDSSGVTRLTNNTNGDGEPAWLPADGSTIAFASDRADTSCEGSCYYDIWSMGGDGSSPVQLTDDHSYNFHPSYSPDGTKIAFQGVNPQFDSPNRIIGPDEGTEIFIIPSGGESVGPETPLLPADQTGLLGQTLAAFDSYPAWSPDGTKIAFTRLTEGLTKGGPIADVRTYVAPASGTGPATPVETYPQCIIPDSPARAHAIQAAFAKPTLQATRAALRGLLPPGCLWDLKPAWSPDGTKLAATRITGQQPPTGASTRGGIPFGEDEGDIVVFNSSDGSGDTNLSNLSEPTDCNTGSDTPECSVDEYPTWSPDGTKIVFDSNRNQPDGSHDPAECSQLELEFTCDYEIWTMNADGSGLTRLTNNTADDFFPDWQRIPPPPPPPPVVPPVTPAVVPPKVGVAGVRRACVSKSFHVRFHIATTSSSVKSVVVKLDGKRIKSTSRGSFTLTINAKKLSSGRHRLTITATDSNGHVTTTHKSFSVCKAAKPRRKAAPRFTG